MVVKYAARHTFAILITLEEGISLEVISNMLGHSSIKTTQIYAKIQEKAIREAMKDLMHGKDKKKGGKNKLRN